MQNMQITNNDKDAMLSVLKSLKGYFLYATLFSASVNFLMLTPIIYMLQVYDRVVSSGSMSTLAMLSLLMVLLLMASGGFEWARSRILVAANVRLENQLRDLVSKASFRHSLLSGSPAASHLAMSDLLGLRQFITGNGVFAFMDAPWTPIYIVVMFMFHPLFGIAAIICAVILIALAIIMEKVTAQKLLEANKLTTAATQSFQSNLRNAEVIHGMGMQAAIRQKDGKLYQAAGNEQAIGSAAAGRLTAISKSFRLIAQSIVLGLGAYLALNQQISPGMMIAGSLLLGRALAPIDMMVGTWKNFVDAKSSFKRLRLILSSYVEEADKMDLPKPVGNLSVEQIIVIPPGAQAASVKGVGFQLAAGEALGIIGPSAAGKTSLARGILGVWPARAGTVRLDNAEIDQWVREKLGPYIGYLPQDIELFDGTIAENICRFSELNSELIIEAAKTAGIHEMILRLPQGYDTIISSQSGALSAGQRQRVALARAIYNLPKLIILDEPNSNLDDQGERDLLSALQKMKQAGSTVIVITHRTSILSLVDKLLLMRDGLATNFGQRDDVLKAIAESNNKVAKLQQKV
ncbi:MAG: type I secretion system permease/ATPase [Gammaproteobacteria bacterium]|nr:type I secretion system permease/ATPase [Gammaproteobacteria bacterium]MDD9959948.1 type I secretion system permease/ATPase [Gammaproteobacteria bacterium]